MTIGSDSQSWMNGPNYEARRGKKILGPSHGRGLVCGCTGAGMGERAEFLLLGVIFWTRPRTRPGASRHSARAGRGLDFFLLGWFHVENSKGLMFFFCSVFISSSMQDIVGSRIPARPWMGIGAQGTLCSSGPWAQSAL
jgi:hypothetical protein